MSAYRNVTFDELEIGASASAQRPLTQTEIDNGQLIVVVGVAPVKPAEFGIVRIGLWTAHPAS